MSSSVDGLVSGLNTTQIISQLMQLEAQPQQRLINQRATINTQMSALQAINNKFSALQTAAAKLTTSDEWHARTATSSSSLVTATAAPGALTGSITFDVQQVAKAEAYVSATTFSATTDTATSSTSITITKGTGSPVTVNVGDGSLGAVVSAINNANAGVSAAVVQVGTSSYKLQLTSSTTGANSTFTIADGANATPLGTLNELAHGQDASLIVGNGSPGQYTVTSSSNTITNVLPGVTMTLSAGAAGTTGVTVTTGKDSSALVSDVQAMVDAANAALSAISSVTAYDTKTNKGQPLVGDSTVRGLQEQVLDMVTGALGGTTANAATVGLAVDKTGTITFDSSKFTTAFNNDPDGTARLFRPGGTMVAVDPAYSALTADVTFLSAGDQTVPGNYDVKITQAASQALVQVSGAIASGEQLTLTSLGKTATVTAQVGDTLTTLASRINDASAANGLGLTARIENGNLMVRTVAYGSQPTFTLTTNGTLAVAPIVAGKDVAGTINGVVATGIGQALEAPATDTTLHGLSLLVTATAADVATAAGQVGANQNLFGSFHYTPGLAQQMSSLASNAVRSGTGLLTTEIAGKQSLIDDLTKQISDWDPILTQKQDDYKRQYATLETALGKLKDQASWLSGQLASLPSGSSTGG